MITNKSIIRLGFFGLLAFAIAGTPTLSQAQSSPTDTTTNAVKTVKHKKKKTADTNAPAATTPTAAPAAPTTPPPPPKATTATATTTTTTQAGHNKSGVLPFHGKLKAVDTAAMTISVGTRTFSITSETIIIKDGKPATLADGVVGDETGGAYKKTDDGKLVVTKLRFGAKSATESTGTK
jgi:cytoskeletal protein RodZ